MLRTLMSVDDLVGSVFATLQANGELSNTLAIFMSDNGYEWGEHGLDFKGDAYDDSVRVPMYVRWPGHVVGRRDRQPARREHRRRADDRGRGGRASGDAPDGRPLDARRRRRPARGSCSSGTRPAAGSAGARCVPRPRTTSSTTTSIDNQTIMYREYYDLTADPWEMDNLLGDGKRGERPEHRRARRRSSRQTATAPAPPARRPHAQRRDSR